MSYRFLSVLFALIIGASCLPVVQNAPPAINAPTATSTRATPRQSPAPPSPPTLNSHNQQLSNPIDVPNLRSNFLYWVNELRRPFGKEGLVWNDTLDAMAETWAQAHNGLRLYMAHEHGGVTLTTRANKAGYTYFDLAENLCRTHEADGKMIFELWRGSKEHRENMLGPATEVGLACILSDSGVADAPKYVCVAVFGRPTT